MAFDIGAIRHPSERIHGIASIVAGSLLWAGYFVYLLLGEDPAESLLTLVAFAVLFWGFSAAARALTRAHMFGHFVLVGPDQFPRIHSMVVDGAKKLGLTEAPMTFIYNSDGVMNAFAVRLVGRKRYIWLTSALVDADSEEQLRFVIGHELGHHVAGHLEQIPYLLRWPVMVVPYLGAAYSRGRELTCDRVGALLVQDVDVSRTALQMLACGSAKLNAQMNGAAFAAQEMLVPPIAGFVLRITSGYPRLTKRVDEVARWLETRGDLHSRPTGQAVAAVA